MSKPLTPAQLSLVEQPLDARTFLEGPPGCGKTTAAVERLLYLMANGVPGSSILVILPQRTLARPYSEALRVPGLVAGGAVSLSTLGGLARRMIDLFWPLVAGPAGFSRPDLPPVFLTLETAQYYMAHLVRPLLDQGFFASISLDRNRLYSQVIDNLNKAAVVGFEIDQIAERLKTAWGGDPGQARVYEDAQECALRFRQYCLEHNLLDFSLQIEAFHRHLWGQSLCHEYLLRTYRHLIADNLEEDTPVAHDILRDWLPHFESALLVCDEGGGYRSFLGADPRSAYSLSESCSRRLAFDHSFVSSPAVQALGARLAQALNQDAALAAPQDVGAIDPRPALHIASHRFYPQMLDWVAGQVAELVSNQSLPPQEIAILSPFLSDSLRFSLATRLESRGIPLRTHRPSRSLREESVVQCLLTLSCLAHPSWGLYPSRFDVAYALIQAIDGLDLVRAQLLAEIVFRLQGGVPVLSSFERIEPPMQSRLTYRIGMLYERLRLWLAEYAQRPEEQFDYFLSRLFGELLSQPGYRFHRDLPSGEVAANLIESVQKFRWAAGAVLDAEGIPLGQEYFRMVQEGVIAAQYLRSWQPEGSGSVLAAPAYTFLMANRPVEVQFWLDIGSRGWFERLYQPLTHPYVLNRRWTPGQVWTDLDEYHAGQEVLVRLALGLLRRCRSRVYLGLCELNEGGYEQRGPLLHAFQRLLRTAAAQAA